MSDYVNKVYARFCWQHRVIVLLQLCCVHTGCVASLHDHATDLPDCVHSTSALQMVRVNPAMADSSASGAVSRTTGGKLEVPVY